MKLSKRLQQNRHFFNRQTVDCLIELAQTVEAIDEREQKENRYLWSQIAHLSNRIDVLMMVKTKLSVDRELIKAALAACQIQSPWDSHDLSTALENIRQVLEQALGD